DVEGNLDRPAGAVLLARAVRPGGWWVRRGIALLKLAKGRPRAPGRRVLLPAHVRKAEGSVEDLEVVANRLAAEGIPDDDGLALALVACLQQRCQVVRGLLRLRVEAAPVDGGALALRRRSLANAHELDVAPGRVENDRLTPRQTG